MKKRFKKKDMPKKLKSLYFTEQEFQKLKLESQRLGFSTLSKYLYKIIKNRKKLLD